MTFDPMSHPMIEHVDMEPLWHCGYTVASTAGDHICGRPAIASAVGPQGERLPLCSRHERTALAAVALPRFSEWLIEAAS